jgi:hypothetical protein
MVSDPFKKKINNKIARQDLPYSSSTATSVAEGSVIIVNNY